MKNRNNEYKLWQLSRVFDYTTFFFNIRHHISDFSSQFPWKFMKYNCRSNALHAAKKSSLLSQLCTCRFSRVEKSASHRLPRASSSRRTSPRDRSVGRSMSSRCVSRGKILRDTAITDEPTHTVCDSDKQDSIGTGRDRTGQDRLSLGIRTVNPGFYSPGIEVYSVLSRPRPCAPYPFAYVCLSYVQPSCGKTFAYLRSSTRCWSARVRGAQESLPLRPPSFPPPFAAISCPLDRRRFLGSVRHPPPLCPRNEIFVKNARFILTSSPPDRSLHPSLPFPSGLLRPVEY